MARHVYCKRYAECLDHAIERDLEDFDCEGCPRYEHEAVTIESTLQDALGGYRLLMALWPKHKRFKRILDGERQRQASKGLRVKVQKLPEDEERKIEELYQWARENL